jgi:hypothetical protein
VATALAAAARPNYRPCSPFDDQIEELGETAPDRLTGVKGVRCRLSALPRPQVREDIERALLIGERNTARARFRKGDRGPACRRPSPLQKHRFGSRSVQASCRARPIHVEWDARVDRHVT